MRLAIKKLSKDVTVLITSIVVCLYFILLILIHKISYEPVLIGVFKEILTLPFIALSFVLLGVCSFSFIKGKFKIISYPFYSLIVMVFTFTLMIVFA